MVSIGLYYNLNSLALGKIFFIPEKFQNVGWKIDDSTHPKKNKKMEIDERWVEADWWNEEWALPCGKETLIGFWKDI